jgi:hypothetical protein
MDSRIAKLNELAKAANVLAGIYGRQVPGFGAGTPSVAEIRAGEKRLDKAIDALSQPGDLPTTSLSAASTVAARRAKLVKQIMAGAK